MSSTEGVPSVPDRADDAHKGSVGRIVIVGGRLDDVGMVGAPALAANAAFRTGAGLVQILTTRDAQAPVSVLAPCATTRVMKAADAARLADLAAEFSADVVAIGPGLSPLISGQNIHSLLSAFSGSIVVDADALNALATLETWRAARPNQVVVTPHPGEMGRLLKGLGIDVDVSRREAAAQVLARETSTVVVHKGAGTVVADESTTYINRTGHSGMATGGAGDVLTGIIAALIGQGMGAYEAAILGVYLHGRAGQIAAEQLGTISITAAEMVEAIAPAIHLHRGA